MSEEEMACETCLHEGDPRRTLRCAGCTPENGELRGILYVPKDS